tara:strand:- start:300 stop:455 length:156 start_codon:yes stop_codon:yes gene_type:complete
MKTLPAENRKYIFPNGLMFYVTDENWQVCHPDIGLQKGGLAVKLEEISELV